MTNSLDRAMAGHFLAERAERIRQLGRAAIADVIEIGRLLIECREHLPPHGAWLRWLEREFLWTDRTALNFMRVAALAANSKRISDLDIPLGDLYLLAAPGTPETARKEVIERVASGEPLRRSDIAAIIAQHGKPTLLRIAKQLRAEDAEIRRAERLERMAEISKANAPLPTGKRYPVILADPPWYFEGYTTEEAHERAPQYPTMRFEELCALPVANLATDDAILFLWSTSAHLRLAFGVMEAWGFTYSSDAVWTKTNGAFGLGHFFRQQHETLLVGRRGDFPAPPPSTRPSSVIPAPRREHSRKPDEVYEIIEEMFANLPKIELFARHARPGWTAWGNQLQPCLEARAGALLDGGAP